MTDKPILTLNRCVEFTNDCTLGSLWDGDQVICKTLELPWRQNEKNVSCIPCGVYTVRPHFSKRYQHCYAFDDEETAPRTKIRIHGGNWASDTRGCVLPGRGYEQMYLKGSFRVAVSRSNTTLDMLLDEYPDGFMLRILGKLTGVKYESS